MPRWLCIVTTMLIVLTTAHCIQMQRPTDKLKAKCKVPNNPKFSGVSFVALWEKLDV